MMILVLGGTSWLGDEVARVGLARGHEVTCLARCESGPAPSSATFVRADRAEETAHDQVCDRDWDGVVDVSWQPGFVRRAVAALDQSTRTGVYVSSRSVYAVHDTIGADESADLLPALQGDEATMAAYGEAKVACERAIVDGVGRGRAVTDAATTAGLVCRPLEQTLADVLHREVTKCLGRDDRAGLSPQEERHLIAAARS